MTRRVDARTAVLRAIRENLRASEPHDARAHAAPHGSSALPVIAGSATTARLAAGAGGVPRFQAQLEAVGGHCAVVRGVREAAQELSRILSVSGAQRVVASDAPLVHELLQAAGAEFVGCAVGQPTRAELFACDAGVTLAQWGIAETGTLVLESAHERNRLASLVPRLHIALLPAAHICETLAEALARVRASDATGELASRAITFITGPSRTSDIELTLVIGVHGPQELHVIVLSDDLPGVTP